MSISWQEVKKVGRKAEHPEAQLHARPFDGRMYVLNAAGRGVDRPPRSGWLHNAGCDCQFSKKCHSK